MKLPRQDLQLRHLLVKTLGSSIFVPVRCNTLEYFKKVFGHGHEASVYYKMLMTTLDPQIMSLKRAWETEWETLILQMRSAIQGLRMGRKCQGN